MASLAKSSETLRSSQGSHQHVNGKRNKPVGKKLGKTPHAEPIYSNMWKQALDNRRRDAKVSETPWKMVSPPAD